MADKSISDLSSISAVTGDEYLYGIQSDGDVKIVADDLVDYILNTYEFNSDVTNTNVIAGKINSLRTITNTADLADRTYPPGSLYWSSSSTSPAALLGGVWARVKDRFALAAGSSYTAGTNGGEAVHLLTLSEFPSHNHGTPTGKPNDNTSNGPNTTSTAADAKHSHTVPSLSGSTTEKDNHTHSVSSSAWQPGSANINTEYKTAYNGSSNVNWSSAGKHKHTFTTAKTTSGNADYGHTHTMEHTHTLSAHTHTISAQGGGGQHNNMPPYVVYYCWERIE